MKLSGDYLTEEQIAAQVERFCYIRKDNRQPIGIVVLDKQGHIGWSLYNESREDEIASTDKGLMIALSRAKGGLEAMEDIGMRVRRVRRAAKSDDRLLQVGMYVELMKAWVEKQDG